MSDDPVNHPKHYTFGKYEVIDVLEGMGMHKNAHLWQVCKYVFRHEHKGNPLEDLKKARFFLEREISRLEAQEKLDRAVSPQEGFLRRGPNCG